MNRLTSSHFLLLLAALTAHWSGCSPSSGGSDGTKSPKQDADEGGTEDGSKDDSDGETDSETDTGADEDTGKSKTCPLPKGEIAELAGMPACAKDSLPDLKGGCTSLPLVTCDWDWVKTKVALGSTGSNIDPEVARIVACGASADGMTNAAIYVKADGDERIPCDWPWPSSGTGDSDSEPKSGPKIVALCVGPRPTEGSTDPFHDCAN